MQGFPLDHLDVSLIGKAADSIIYYFIRAEAVRSTRMGKMLPRLNLWPELPIRPMRGVYGASAGGSSGRPHGTPLNMVRFVTLPPHMQV